MRRAVPKGAAVEPFLAEEQARAEAAHPRIAAE